MQKETTAKKEVRKRFDRAIFVAFFAGAALIITAAILGYTTEKSQLLLSILAILCFLTATVLIFTKSYFTGKKYAMGAKKRRKKYLQAAYGENNIFKNQKAE